MSYVLKQDTVNVRPFSSERTMVQIDCASISKHEIQGSVDSSFVIDLSNSIYVVVFLKTFM